MNKILCIIDGMTDPAFCVRNYPALSSMQPLTAVRTVPPGCQPESLTCILTILGVTNIPPFLRGYVEALGAGIAVQQDDLILRASWFALENGCCTLPIAAPAKLHMDAGIAYYPLGGYKSLLVLPGQADTLESIQTCAFYNQTGRTVGQLCPMGNVALERAFEQNCTESSCMVLWGQSRAAALPAFSMPAAVICGTGVVRGIAKLLNMALILVPGATGDVDTDLVAKADAALLAAQTYPFVLLHINGADEAAHRREAVEKRRFISKVDRLVLRRLLGSDHVVSVMADHATDPVTGLHGGAEQPVFCKKR